MRDSGRQTTHGFETTGPREFLLHAFALADVAQCARKEAPPHVVAPLADRQVHIDYDAVFSAGDDLAANSYDLGDAGRSIGLEIAIVPERVLIRHDDGHIPAEKLVRFVAKDRLRCGVDRLNDPLLVDADDGGGRRVDDRAVLRFAGSKGFLRGFALGNIFGEDDDPSDFACWRSPRAHLPSKPLR